MADNDAYVQAGQQPAELNPDLKPFDRLVGTWNVSRGAQGQIIYEQSERNFFLVQHVDLEQNGREIKGLELMGSGTDKRLPTVQEVFMSKVFFENVRQFFLKDARLLERHLFHHHFEGGSREVVLRALLAYQTEDGGFAYGLEPDKRSAQPQPIDQEQALRILADVGPERTILEQLLDFLPSITTPEGGLPFVLESVADAPRAPWWNTDPDPPAALNPTASVAGLLYKLGVTHPWLEAAAVFVWEKLEALTESDPNTLLSAMVFLEEVPERERAEGMFGRLADEILRHTALETDAEGYVHPPYAFAPRPDALTARLYAPELMARHLDALAATQQADGGWPISWPAVSPGSELEYRSIVTLNALKTLRVYERL